MKNEKKECYLCDSPDILNESCLQCKRPYCVQDAHKLEPFFYCVECHIDLQVEDTTYTRVDPEYNAKTDTTKDVIHSCRQLIFRGMSWIESEKVISQMNLEEQKVAFEIMRAHVLHLESEISRNSLKAFRERLVFNRGGQPHVAKQAAPKTTIRAKNVPILSEANILEIAKKVGIKALLDILNKGKVQ